MTIFASSTLSGRRFSRVLLLLSLAFPLQGGAQTVTAPTTDATNKKQGVEPAEDASPITDNLNRIRFSGGASSHYYLNGHSASAESSWVFFPPLPPPLESEAPVLPPYQSGTPAPAELAAYVGDLFYPMLASRLAGNDLPKTVRAELQAYRSAKLELQNELRSKIAALKEISAGQQTQELAAFAALQTPRIIEWEATAERIRAELRRTGLFGLQAEEDRTRADGAPQPVARDAAKAPVEVHQEAQAIRSAAFYLEGLSSDQRRLLLEAALELDAEANPMPNISQPGQEGWLLSFSPTTARIRLLANLPAPLAKKISEYAAAKQTLKSELRDALLAHANSRSSRRVAALKELADAQAPRIAALDILAEEIRRELAAQPNPPGPPAPPSLPPELMTRISNYRAHKLELLKILYAMLTGPPKNPTAAPNDPPAKPDSIRTNAQPWMRDGTTQTEVSPAKLRVPPGEFSGTQTRLLAELNKEQAGIREALAEHFRTTNQPMDRKSINDLLKDFETSRQKQEIWDKYRDYQTAVLLPGLSPEQRRLLFAAAIEQLSLPLPAGEKVP